MMSGLVTPLALPPLTRVLAHGLELPVLLVLLITWMWVMMGSQVGSPFCVVLYIVHDTAVPQLVVYTGMLYNVI